MKQGYTKVAPLKGHLIPNIGTKASDNVLGCGSAVEQVIPPYIIIISS